MTQKPPTRTPDAQADTRVMQVLEAYLAGLEQGVPPDPESLITAHPELADELRGCLASLEFLHGAAVKIRDQQSQPVVTADIEFHDDRRLGDFRIRREIGRGGMGVVYEAEQISLKRRVALKVLPFAGLLDQRQLERFKNEAQIAAGLKHPNIVSVHYVGSDRGVHFYAMEYVDGQSLAQAISQLRSAMGNDIDPASAPASDSERDQGPQADPGHVSTTETEPVAAISTVPAADGPRHFDWVAEIGIQAAEALDHAHQVGIVHRDIKPSNLLLDTSGHLWIADFGLAMTQTERSLTMPGDLLGTLRYMSPEQASGNHTRLDHRTDVYSLGVTLYELAMLRPAFAADDRQQLLRQIADVEPLAPRRLNSDIPDDLETIILKAVSKEPEGRYATAQELADDLGRFLENKPIVARRPALVSRAAKWARRNSVLLTAIATTLILSLALSTAALWREQQKTAKALVQSEANWQLAQDAVDDMYSGVAMEWLDHQPHFTDVQREFLEKAVDFYARLPKRLTGDVSLRFETAKAHYRAGAIELRLRHYERAWEHLNESLSQYKDLCQQAPGHAEYVGGTAQVLHRLGHLHQYQGRLEEAIQTHEEALRLAAQASAGDHDNIRVRREIAKLNICLGEFYAKNKQPDRASDCLRTAIQLGRELTRQSPESQQHECDLIDALAELSDVANSDAERERLICEAIDRAEKVFDAHPSNTMVRVSLAIGCGKRAIQLARDKQFDEAIKSSRRSLKAFQQISSEFPDWVVPLESLVASRANLARILKEAGNLDGAVAEAREWEAAARSLVEDRPEEPDYRRQLAQALGTQADICFLRSDYPGAIDHYDKLLVVDPTCPGANRNRAAVHMKLGQLDEAMADARKAVELHPADLASRNLLGGVHYRQRQFEAAAQAYAQLIKMDPKLALGYGNRGMTRFGLGRYDEALADLARALNLNPKDPYANAAMAWLLVAGPAEMRDPQKAAAIAQNSPVLDAEKQKLLGGVCFRLGQYAQAKNALTDAVEHANEPSFGDLGERLLFLAMACHKLGDHEDAHKWFTRAETWIGENAGPEDVHLQNIRQEAAALIAGLAAKLAVPEDDGPDDLDPRGNHVLVAREPSVLTIRLYSSHELPTAASQWHGVTMTRDGRPLQAGLDYDLRYDPERQMLAVEPAAGVFEDGVYRISIPRTLPTSKAPPTGLAVSVCSLLPTSRHVTFQNSGGGYSSARYEPYEPIELVPRGADWRYLDDGSDQSIAWRELEFDDSRWNTGRAQLGYGDGDETTVIGFGPDGNDKYPAAYFRRIFQVADPARSPLLRLQLLHDDGAAVYLNGREIIRDSLPDSASHNAYASATVGGESESVYASYIIKPQQLRKGDNCLAVEVHQASPSSSDMSFDLRLGSPPLAVVAFDDLIGKGQEQIPKGALVLGATLRFAISEDGPTGLRLRQIVNSGRADAGDVSESSTVKGTVNFDVKHAVQAWRDDKPNLGWFLLAADESSGLDGVQQSPELVVSFVASGDLAPLSWHFANCADAELRDPVLALEYAQRALKSSPEDTNSRTALGAALYRNGKWDEAITALENVLKLDSANQRASIILVMAYAESGRQESARKLLALLPKAREPSDLSEDELSRLRGEAERLLIPGD